MTLEILPILFNVLGLVSAFAVVLIVGRRFAEPSIAFPVAILAGLAYIMILGFFIIFLSSFLTLATPLGTFSAQ